MPIEKRRASARERFQWQRQAGSLRKQINLQKALISLEPVLRVQYDPVLSTGGAAKIKFTPLYRAWSADRARAATTCIDLECPSSARQRELQGLLCRPNRYKTSKEQCAQNILFITCSCNYRKIIRAKRANLTWLFRPLSVIVTVGPAVYCRRLGHPGSHHPQTIYFHYPVSQRHWTGTETQAAFAMYAVFAARGRPRLSNGEQVWNTRSARRSATQSMAPAGYKQLIKGY